MRNMTANLLWIVFKALPVLTRSGPKFADIYPEVPMQRDVCTQADMFLAVSSPKQPSPAPTSEATISFGDEDIT